MLKYLVFHSVHDLVFLCTAIVTSEVNLVSMGSREIWVISELTFYLLILILSQLQFWDSSREISNCIRVYISIPDSRI